MNVFIANRMGWFVATAGLVVLTAGCGGSGVLVTPSSTPAIRSTATPLPRTVVPSPSPSPVPALTAPRVEARLQATLKTLQKATLGMGKATAEVEVMNPAPITLQGTIKVSFVATGRSEAKVQTRTITVPAQGRETVSFVETAWFVKEATVEVTTLNGGLDPHAPGTY